MQLDMSNHPIYELRNMISFDVIAQSSSISLNEM